MALFWLSGAFVLGVVVGGAVDPRLALAVSCSAVVVGLVARRTLWGRFALIVAALALGCARSPHDAGPPSRNQLSFYNGRLATIAGQVVAEPDIRDTGANYEVAARAVSLRGRVISVSGRLEMHTSRGQQLEYGDEVQLTGVLQTPVNSAALRYRDILHARGIDSQMQFPRAVDLGTVSAGYLGWIVPFREQLERGLNRWLPEPEAALLIAITLGAHSASLGALAPALVATGLIHLIAISGIKVAVVAGTVWTVLVRLTRRVVTLVVSLLTVLFYVLLTGATASGERSALMWALVFIASYLGRRTVALVSLGFAAALMVALDPMLPWDIGFQLSTVGTFSIVALSGPFLRLFRFVPSPFREALGVTLAAQLGTVPIVAGGFQSLSLIGPLANALVLPLLPLTIVLGFVLGLIANIPVLAAPLSVLAYAAVHPIVWLSERLATSSAALHVSSPTTVISFAYYAALGGVAWFLLRRAGWAPLGEIASRGREVALALLLVASAATVSQAQGASPDRLTFLGSGTALLVQSAGRTALIDGSPRPLAFLSALSGALNMGVHSLDLVIVTDPRSSNVTGLVSLLDHYRVGAVIDVGSEYPSRTYATWRQALRSFHVPVYALRTGTTAQVGRVTLRALGPDALCYAPANCAGLLILSSGSHTFLIATHAGIQEQEDAVFRRVALPASSLLLGDAASSAPDFRDAVHAHRVWCIAAKVAASTSICTFLRQGHSQIWPL